jgi:hypothetical protein
MNKAFLIEQVEARKKELKKRYKNYALGFNDNGKPLSYGVANYKRTTTRRDLGVLTLIAELLGKFPEKAELSSEAMDGYDRLVLPTERHHARV